MRPANKVAIVTGAASGFGRAIAETFAREGAKVVVADINGQVRARRRKTSVHRPFLSPPMSPGGRTLRPWWPRP